MASYGSTSYGGGSRVVTATPLTDSYADTVLADTPNAYYRLNEPSGSVATDFSGNSRNGTYFNAVTYGVAGLIAQDSDTAITLLGGVSGTEVQSASSGIGGIVHSIWVQNPPLGGIIMRDSTTTDGWLLWLQSPNVVIRIGGGTYTTSYGSSAITDGNKHHIVWGATATTVFFYVDGVLRYSAARTDGAAPVVLPWHLGRNGDNNDYVAGTFDEWSIHSALSADRVSAYYDAGADPTTARLVGHTAAIGNNTGGAGTVYAVTLTKPVGVTSDDLLIWHTHTRNTIPSAAGPEGTGWTKYYEYATTGSNAVTPGSNADNERHTCWYKVAGSSEPASYAFNRTQDASTTNATVDHLSVWRNAEVGGFAASPGSTAPSVSGAAGGVLLCFWGASLETTAYTITPTGMTLLNRIGGTNQVYGQNAYQLLTAAEATGTKASDAGMTDYAIVSSIALNPVPVTGDGTVEGVVATVTTSALAGEATGGLVASVEGVTASSVLAAPAGTATASSVSGPVASTSLVAPAGTATGNLAASVAGAPATIAATAVPGFVSEVPSVQGLTALINTQALAGLAGAGTTVMGVPATLLVAAPNGGIPVWLTAEQITLVFSHSGRLNHAQPDSVIPVNISFEPLKRVSLVFPAPPLGAP